MATLDFPSPPTPNGFSHVVAVAPDSRLIVTSGQVPVAADGSVPSGWAVHRVGPEPVVARAIATTGDLVSRLTAGIEPFETAAAARLAAYSGQP
ncbi:hypothetical protein AB0F72_28540 [Actinoplanes sp. NPDC023936]|uniref:hypothetical protein n=1 Tax=Actinoplanes sp. NPDC023936 TaxID=3154910 RepID=UPI00340C2F7D